jgi:hypothetical protein
MATNKSTGSRQSSVSTKETGLNQLTTMLIAAVLRYNTDKEHPMGNSEIAKKISDITDQYFDSKIVDRHLKYITELTNIATSKSNSSTSTPSQQTQPSQKATISSLTQTEAKKRLNAVTSVIGGYIRCQNANKTPKNKDAANLKKVYYYDPLINESEYNLIKGALTSNRYIQQAEKCYLSDALHFLHPFISDNDQELAILSPVPKRKASSTASIVLDNVNKIFDAIYKNNQLEIEYGAFKEKAGRICFEADGKGVRVINPYAMLWSNGQHYLIATTAEEDTTEDVKTAEGESTRKNIYHFRIDRIRDIKLHKTKKILKNGNTVYKMSKRDELPDALKPFFVRGIFQEESYRSTYPHMSFSDQHESEEVLINCRNLSILVDNFGQDGRFMYGETVITQKKDVNLPFPDGYTVRIKGVDYNSIKRLCLHMQDDIYVIEPTALRDEIIAELKSKLTLYEGI